MLGLRDVMAGPVAAPGITTRMLEQELGMELGVARISLGLASNFADVCSVIEFARRFDDWRGMDAYLACMRSGR